MAIEDGDGRALPPMRWWQLLHRTLFGIRRDGHVYAVDVDLFDDKAALYVDGAQAARSSLPVSFDVAAGTIRVETSLYGLKRMHLLDGAEQVQLTPAPLTAEHWRAELDRRRPRVSRWIARAAVVVLLAALALTIPQVLAAVSQWEIVADRIGTVTLPFEIPVWLTTTATVAGVLASIERALTLRNHWLIDLDTTWFS